MKKIAEGKTITKDCSELIGRIVDNVHLMSITVDGTEDEMHFLVMCDGNDKPRISIIVEKEMLLDILKVMNTPKEIRPVKGVH